MRKLECRGVTWLVEGFTAVQWQAREYTENHYAGVNVFARHVNAEWKRKSVDRFTTVSHEAILKDSFAEPQSQIFPTLLWIFKLLIKKAKKRNVSCFFSNRWMEVSYLLKMCHGAGEKNSKEKDSLTTGDFLTTYTHTLHLMFVWGR